MFKVFSSESEVQKIIYTNYSDKNIFTDSKHVYSESLYFFHDIFPIIGYTFFKSYTYRIENVLKFRPIEIIFVPAKFVSRQTFAPNLIILFNILIHFNNYWDVPCYEF